MNEDQTQLVGQPEKSAGGNNLLRDLSAIGDVPLRTCIEIGRLRLSVGEFLRLNKGAVIELKKPAGEPFELSFNGYVVAKGEVIMVDQTSSVRIVEVLKPAGSA